MTRYGDWFLTHSGRQFWPLDPHIDDICIEDIAHALSLICRFGGHTREFYSVAQHSVIVCDALPREFKLTGLLHDATEAYVGDMIRPLKIMMPEYRTTEQFLWQHIATKFDLPIKMPLTIKEADNRALMTERRDLLITTDHVWSGQTKFPPFSKRIEPMPPQIAEHLFLNRFQELAT